MRVPDPSWKGQGQGSEVRVSSASPILHGREATVPAPPSDYLYHRPSVFPGMLKRAL